VKVLTVIFNSAKKLWGYRWRVWWTYTDWHTLLYSVDCIVAPSVTVWRNEWISEWRKEWMSEWVSEQMNEWMIQVKNELSAVLQSLHNDADVDLGADNEYRTMLRKCRKLVKSICRHLSPPYITSVCRQSVCFWHCVNIQDGTEKSWTYMHIAHAHVAYLLSLFSMKLSFKTVHGQLCSVWVLAVNATVYVSSKEVKVDL